MVTSKRTILVLVAIAALALAVVSGCSPPAGAPGQCFDGIGSVGDGCNIPIQPGDIPANQPGKVQDCREIPPGFREGTWISEPDSAGPDTGGPGAHSYPNRRSCELDRNRLD